MSPNGTSSICCCSRVFRRSSSSQKTTNPPNNSHLEPIEIKVNGQPHLMVPHVAIRPTSPAPTIPIQLAPDTLSEINLELFETARTSRTNDSKLHPMTELIRMTRIEEGLEVTPRVDTGPSTSIIYPNMSVVSQPPPLETIPEISEREIPKNRSKPKKAVFNEDGDITTRSSTSKNSHNIVVPPIFSLTNAQRRVSTESIGVPIITIPSQTSISIQQQPSRALIRSSPISRRISATPQMITALVAYTYAFYASNEAWRELSHLKRAKRYNCQEKSQNCPPGPQGPLGKAGRDGEPGEPGIDGTDGSSGISVAVAGGCIKCPAGKPGKRGKKGEMGRKGKNGKKGISVKAVIGSIGLMGSIGVPGYPGFPGPPGPIGPPGRDSNRFINPPGPLGPPGREGYQGAQGPAGFVYNTGLVGPVGLSGRDGLNGKPGDTGKTGRKGRPGRDGNYCECPTPRIPRRYI